MEKHGIIEAVLFSVGKTVKKAELANILEISVNEIEDVISKMNEDYKDSSRGIEIIKIEDGYKMVSKKEYYEYLYPVFDKRSKLKLSQASLETLAIIAYNQKITRSEIDAIRGVDSSASVYKLQEYNLIEQLGKSDLPGKPIMYGTTEDFLRKFNMESLKLLPELPKYKMDKNNQIIIEE